MEVDPSIKPLTIAMDFDDTFTADPHLWTSFIDTAKQRGHRVICVTARHRTDESRQEIKAALPEGVPVYFTEMGSKLDYMANQGVRVSVWCDDSPRTLVHGH
jgi:hypothetical protein